MQELVAIGALQTEPSVKTVSLFGRNTDIDTSAEDVTDLGGNYTPPTAARVHAIVSSSAEDGDDSAQATATITIDHYDQMLPVKASGTITVVDWTLAAIIKATGTVTYGSPTAAIRATGTITFGSPTNDDTVVVAGTTFTKKAAGAKATGSITYGTPVQGDTVEVNGHIFTKVTVSPGANQFTTIAQLTALVDALSEVSATDNGTTVSIVAASNGVAGNSYTLSIPEQVGTMAVSGATLSGGVADPTGSNFGTITELTALIQALATVNATDNGTVITVTAATAGTGGNSITMTKSSTGLSLSGATLANGVAGSIVTVDGTALECTDTGASATQFTSISTLTALIEALTNVNATDNGTVITIVAAAGGTAGNSITLSKTGTGLSVSGATLSGGRAAATIGIGATTLTANVDFTAATDNTTTAENLKVAIDAISGVGATRSGLVITVTDDDYDESGNSTGTTTSVAGFATVQQSTLAGGEDVSAIVVNGVTFTAGTDFAPGASNTAAATALKNAINASVDVLIAGVLTATSSSGVVTLTAVTAGAAGNSLTLVCADTDAVTVSGANFTLGDDANITGVTSIRITGVDSTYAEITEDIDLNGTGSKNTVNSYLRINSMVALGVGSNGSAVGNITATAATDGTVTAKILAGKCEAQNAYYTVPLNKTGFILSSYASLPALGSVTGQLAVDVREYGKGWVSRGLLGLSGTVVPVVPYTFPSPVVAPAKSDIRLRANTSTDNVDVIAGAQILVVADENA